MRESNWTRPDDECPNPELWHAPDSTAAELEVSQFLAALCVVMRPRFVLETGAYLGHTSAAIGRALKGVGHLDAVEKDLARCHVARQATRGLPVTVHHAYSLTYVPARPLDLIFFDSDIGARYDEMKRFRRFASRRCVWALHDTKFPVLREAIERLKSEDVIRSSTAIPSPRGLAIGRFR
jgi:hypothetical protein